MKTNTQKRWFGYGIGSILFLLLPILSSPDFHWDFSVFSVRPFQRSFISYAFLLMFFYAQTFYFLPKFYFNKRPVAFWICIILCFIICAAGPIAILPRGLNNNHHTHHHSGSNGMLPPAYFLLTQYLFQFLVVAIFSYTLHINAKRKQAERARVDAELAYLKAQINPHFLFNTLNSIYALAIQKSDATADAVVQLSSMMRYVLTEASKEFVPLQKEIEYISDYIELQKTRLSESVTFNYKIEGIPGFQPIAPMLLIPFVENTFKYGVNPDEDCAIDIKFIISMAELQMHTFNKKVKLRAIHSESNNMGIENARQRLMNLYPDTHKLQITEDEVSFTVFLSIKFK